VCICVCLRSLLVVLVVFSRMAWKGNRYFQFTCTLLGFCCILLLYFFSFNRYVAPKESSHKGIYSVPGISLNANSNMISPLFAEYVFDGLESLSRWWILTPASTSTVHRFFDTSPFSPSGRYIGLTRMSVEEDRPVEYNDKADIIVIDLITGKTEVIAETSAWDSQVGSHVQWGTSDHELYYNTIDHPKSTQEQTRGVVYNREKNSFRKLDCPIYQISPNGLYSASPDLTQIKYTQLGYGVYVHHSSSNLNASKSTGLFVSDLHTGRCKLVTSLFDIATYAGIPVDIPMYGFHAKWSSDNSMIMFVVRTLSPPHQDSSFSTLLSGSKAASARINHMFAIRPDGEILCHVVSWGSACNQLATRKYVTNSGMNKGIERRITHTVGRVAVRGDGNHPSWIPDSHNISLNYRQVCDYPSHEQAKYTRATGSDRIPVWKIAVYNVDELIKGSADARSAAPQAPIDSYSITRDASERGSIVYPYGTGHPNFFPGGRYALVDAYLKEAHMFRGGLQTAHTRPQNSYLKQPLSLPSSSEVHESRRGVVSGGHGVLPLRLVDTLYQREVWITEVRTSHLSPVHTEGSYPFYT
jgi:hypothetical protein